MDNTIGSSIVDDLLSKPIEEPGAPPEPAPAPEATPGAMIVDDMLRTQEIEDRVSIRRNGAIDPTRQAEALRLSEQHSIPIGMAYRQVEDLQRTNLELANEERRKNNPAWGTLLTRDDVGAIAADEKNAEELQFIEQSFANVANPHSLLGDLAFGWDQLVGQQSAKSIANAAEDLQRLKEGKPPRWSGFAPGGMPAPQLTDEEWRAKIGGEFADASQAQAAAQQDMARNPESRAMTQFNKSDAPFSYLLQNPQLLLEIPARSALSSTPSMVAGGVGFAVGGPAGGALGAFAGSADAEYASTITDELTKRGANFNDPATVLAIWDKDGEAILRKAETRGGVVGLFDGLSALVGGKIAGIETPLNAPLKKVLLAVIGKELLGISTDMAFGAGGEAAATAATGDELKVSNILAEAIGELVPGVVQTTTAIVTEGRAAKAEARKQALIELGDKIRKSKIAQTSPETIIAHAQALDDTGQAPQMSVPAAALLKLFQSEGLTPEQAEERVPGILAAIGEADQTNVEVSLPAGAVVRLAQMESFSSITGDIRMGEEPTANEAARDVADLDKLIADVSEEDKKAAVKASAESEVTKQMVAAGMEQRTAETNAKLHIAALSQLASGSGKSIDTLMQEFPLQIVREGMDSKALDGTTLQQADVLARSPELQDAMRKLQAGEITRADYAALVDQVKPVAPYAAVPQPASREAMQAALTEDKVSKVGLPDQLPEGHPVGLRLDIPAYARHNTWVVSVHEQKSGFAAGQSIGYSSVARATNVELGVVQNAAANIAGGKPKATIAVMKGSWKQTTPEQAKVDADAALSDPAWRQIGMDPERHAYFYDRETMEPITNAEEVIQVGPLVLGKNVTYGDKSTFLFQIDPAFNEPAIQIDGQVIKASDIYPNQVVQSRVPTKRGFIEIAPGRTEFKITLTGKADLSTYQHEAAHYYLEVLQALVERGSASPEMAADLEKIRAWMGLDAKKGTGPAQKIGVREHEMFARGWEAYLMEGRAPSNDLQGTFNRFRAWMVFVYKRMTALDVQLTDEVRSVFDRLVASDEAIAEARTSIGVTKPLPKTALYLSDDEYDRYVEAWNKANEEQQRELDGKLMREAAQETRQAWKEERARLIKEETDALSQTRGWRAWKLLSEGLGLEDTAPGRSAIKIDPETVPSEWRRDTAGMTEEGGLPFDFVAEFLGFNSGEEMISLIAGAKMAERDIPRKVIQQMKETHGHMDAVQLADAAIDAVHDDKGQEVLLTEYRAMAAKAGIGAPPKGLAQWMAAQASQKVMALTKRQLDPTRWRRAELSAAQKAAAAKDPAQASIHKRQQMMARAMYKATTDASKRVDVIRNKLTPFTKNDRRAKLGKAGDLYLDGIDEILEAIQLKPMSAASIQKLDRLQKLVEEADKNGEPLVLPDKLRAMLGKKNFADMTLEELEGVHDAVMNIWHLAKLKNELKARNEKRQLDEALTEMEANAQAALGDPEVTVKFTKGWKDRAAATMRSFRAGLTKAEFLFGWLDGKPDGGLMHRLLYQPLADANKAKFDILKRFHKTLIERMRNMPNEQKARWEAKRTFMGNPTANGATIISAALNLGNEGNKKKLLEGYGWNEQQLMAEINAFMTKADWDLVQHVWDEINTLWPKIEATTKAATGLAPKKVVAAPVQTPFGTYAGGYYPVVYDPDQTEQQFKNQQENAGLFTNNFARPTLGDGFTEGRVDYAAPILLELSVISRHLAEVVHYVTHYEAITQADKITRHPRFQAVVTGHMGKEFYRTIRPWLQDIARDQDTPAITKTEPFAMAMRYLRGGVSIGAMGYNIFTGVKQLMGVVQSLDAIGPKYWLSGLTKSWMSPNAVKNWKFAFANSQELEPLVTQFDRDIKMINDAYAKQGTMSIPAKVSAAAFAHIGWLQSAVNVATWHGAYEQEIARSGDHDKAVMHADAVIRQTQSAGAVKDLSPIQRGSEINRAVSMFYSWFNVLYNRLESIAKETKGVRDVPRAAMRVAILVMVTSMIEEAGRRAWEGVVDNYDEDDEERGYILSVLMKSADTLIGAIPLARAFISAEAAAGGMKPEITPVGRVSTDYYRTMGAAYDFIVNQEAPSRSEAKTIVRTISTLSQVPLSGPYNFLDELFGEAVFDERKKKN